MDDASLYLAISSVIAAVISGFVVIRGQKQQNVSDSRAHSNAQVKTIFEGYGQIVEELRIEVERLMTTIAILQEEYTVCEERNNSLMEEIEQLKQRIYLLEKHNGK